MYFSPVKIAALVYTQNKKAITKMLLKFRHRNYKNQHNVAPLFCKALCIGNW